MVAVAVDLVGAAPMACDQEETASVALVDCEAWADEAVAAMGQGKVVAMRVAEAASEETNTARLEDRMEEAARVKEGGVEVIEVGGRATAAVEGAMVVVEASMGLVVEKVVVAAEVAAEAEREAEAVAVGWEAGLAAVAVAGSEVA